MGSFPDVPGGNSKEPASKDPTRKSYVLLVTDGAQADCNAAGGDAATTKIITGPPSAGRAVQH